MLKRLLFTLTILAFGTSLSFSQSVGIIGSSTPNGWDSDTDMTQDPDNADMWTISLELGTGAVKFRQDDDWAVNWGASDFPAGIGSQDGDDIPVPAGMYDITFNSATGDYAFTYTGPTYGSVGLIGTATPIGDFMTDTNMVAVTNAPWTYELLITLTDGVVKFRADDDWAVNWGADGFPTDTAFSGGPDIPVIPGEYTVTFNTYDGVYNFENFIPVYNTIGLIGTATPIGDFMTDTSMVQNPSNPSEWSLQVELTDGVAKFRAEDSWDVSWGATDFPSGTGTLGGPDIPVTAGTYNVKFNSATGDYSFDSPLNIYNSVGVIGSGTGNGWDSDTDMYLLDPTQPDQWSIQLTLVDGVMKFRADDDWVVNWGDDGFPTGTGVQDGPDISVFAGTWQIDFNATTGVYSFTPVSVGIIGSALENGWDADEDLTCSTTEGNVWTGTQMLMDGETKFRQDDDWTVNWGAGDFPTGVGTQDGPNIPVPAGAFDVTFNSATGEYSFIEVSSVSNLLDADLVQVFPNPTADNLTVNIEAEELQGEVTIHVMDMSGKVLQSNRYLNMPFINLDVANLTNGMYLLHISNEKFVVGKRFSVMK